MSCIIQFCLNPSCNYKNNRLINQTKSKEIHSECQGWIFNPQNNLNSTFQSSQFPLNFDIKKQPLKCLFSLSNIFKQKQESSIDDENSFNSINNSSLSVPNPFIILESHFISILQQIQKRLKKSYNSIYQRLKLIKLVCENTSNQITQLFKNANHLDPNESSFQEQFSKKINSLQCLQKYKQFQLNYQYLSMLKEQKTYKQMDKICKSIQQFEQCFWSGLPISTRQQNKLKSKVQKQFDKYMKNVQINPTIKLQTITNIFQAKNIQPFISSDKLTVRSKCWICQRNFQNNYGVNLKDKKSSSSSNLLIHILQQHSKQLMLKNTQKIMKDSSYQINLQQFIQQIQQQSYEQFVIIDKQNINLKDCKELLSYHNQKCFIINIVSQQNKNLAIGKYITAKSTGKDAADTLIIFLIYAILNCQYYKSIKNKINHTNNKPDSLIKPLKPKITIMTKDHFAQTLVQIVKNQYQIQIQVKT